MLQVQWQDLSNADKIINTLIKPCVEKNRFVKIFLIISKICCIILFFGFLIWFLNFTLLKYDVLCKRVLISGGAIVTFVLYFLDLYYSNSLSIENETLYFRSKIMLYDFLSYATVQSTEKYSQELMVIVNKMPDLIRRIGTQHGFLQSDDMLFQSIKLASNIFLCFMIIYILISVIKGIYFSILFCLEITANIKHKGSHELSTELRKIISKAGKFVIGYKDTENKPIETHMIVNKFDYIGYIFSPNISMIVCLLIHILGIIGQFVYVSQSKKYINSFKNNNIEYYKKRYTHLSNTADKYLLYKINNTFHSEYIKQERYFGKTKFKKQITSYHNKFKYFTDICVIMFFILFIYYNAKIIRAISIFLESFPLLIDAATKDGYSFMYIVLFIVVIILSISLAFSCLLTMHSEISKTYDIGVLRVSNISDEAELRMYCDILKKIELKEPDKSFLNGFKGDIKFNNFGLKPLFNSINFRIHAGKINMLVAESGFGMTSLLKYLVYQNSEPFHSSGFISVECSGRFEKLSDISKTQLQHHFISGFNNSVINDSLLTNIFLSDIYNQKMIDRVKKITSLQKVFQAYSNLSFINNASGGEKARITIARMIAQAIQNPYNHFVFIFDKNLSGIDRLTRKNILEQIKKFQKKQYDTYQQIITIIYVSDDKFDYQFADHIHHLKN